MDDNAASITVANYGTSGNATNFAGTSPNTENQHSSGKIKHSLNFNGTDHYMNNGTDGLAMASDTTGAVMFWMNFTGTPSNGNVFSCGQNTDNSSRFGIQHDSGGWMNCIIRNGGGTIASNQSTTNPSPDAWTHVALVQDGTSLTWYFNGVAEAGTQSTGAGTEWLSAVTTGGGIDRVTVGAVFTPGALSFYNGQLDDVRYYQNTTTTITAAIVQSIYDAGVAGVYGLGDSIAVPTSEHVSNGNTLLLMHFNHLTQGEDLLDSSTGGVGSPHTVTPTPASNAPGATGHFGNAYLTLDGTGDHIDVADQGLHDIFSDANQIHNISFWVRFADFSGLQCLMTKQAGGGDAWQICQDDGTGGIGKNTFRLQWDTPATGVYNVEADGSAIQDNDWHHVLFSSVGDGSMIDSAIYIDGTQVAFLPITEFDTVVADVRIGSDQFSRDFNGDMDDIHINAANPFSATPVAQPFIQLTMNDNAATTTVINTGTSGNNGTATANTDTLTAAGQINTALTFDGAASGTRVNLDSDISTIEGDSVGAIAMWINPTTLGNRILFIAGNASTDGGFAFNIDNASSNLRMVVQNNTGSPVIQGILRGTGAGSTISTGVWQHAVLSCDGTNTRFYLNGTLLTTTIDTGSDGVWFDDITFSLTRMSVGGENVPLTSIASFDGPLDDVRYYRHPLSQAQVTQIYNSGNGTESFAVDTITVPSTQAVADGNSVLLLNCNTIDESLNKNIPVYNGPSGIGSNFGAFTGSDGALVLDGVNQYLRAPSHADFESNQAGQNITVSTFYYKDVTSVGDDNLVSREFGGITDFDQYLKHVPRTGSGSAFQSAGRSGGNTTWRVDEVGIGTDRTEILANVINHEAWCRVGNNIGYYLNGVQIGGGFYDWDASPYSYAGDMHIGQRGDNTGYWPGKIDETFMTNDNHFNADPMPMPRLHFKCNDNAASGTIDDDGGGASNPFNGLLFSGRLSNTISSVGHVPRSGGSPLSLFFDILAVPAISFDCDALATTSAQGTYHQPVRFDISGTICMWVNQVTQATDQMLFSCGDTVGTSAYGAFFIRSTGVLASNFTNSAGTQVCSYNSTNTIPTGVWTHVAMTQPLDGGGPDFYINGALEVSVGLVTTTPNAWFDAASSVSQTTSNIDNCRIGSYQRNGLASQLYLDAYLDDIRYYQCSLSAAHIGRIYNGGVGSEDTFPVDAGITVPTSAHVADANTMFSLRYEPTTPFDDDGPNNHTFTPFNTPHTTGRFGSSSHFVFDGVNDNIEVPGGSHLELLSDTKDDATIHFWVRHGEIPQVAGEQYFYYANAALTERFILQKNFGSAVTRLVISTASGGTQLIDGIAITDNLWHHIAVIKLGSESTQGASWQVYLDGSQIAQDYQAADSIAVIDDTFYFGSSRVPGDWFEGDMDAIQIVKSNLFERPVAVSGDSLTVPTSAPAVGATTSDIVLISTDATVGAAEATSDTIKFYIDLEDISPTILLDTDIVADVSRDGGSTWTTGALVQTGQAVNGRRLLCSEVDVTAPIQPDPGVGNSLYKYRISTFNDKEMRFHATTRVWG
jgi:hypothetical protein